MTSEIETVEGKFKSPYDQRGGSPDPTLIRRTVESDLRREGWIAKITDALRSLKGRSKDASRNGTVAKDSPSMLLGRKMTEKPNTLGRF